MDFRGCSGYRDPRKSATQRTVPGSTCVLRPWPARNAASAAGYSSSGNRWLINMSGVEHAGGEQLPGPLEAVQHRHRAGDRDLLVVDPERREPCRGVLLRDAELQERAALAPPGPARPRSPPATPVQSMTTSQPRGRSDLVGRARPPSRPSSFAVSSRSGLRSTTDTDAAPAALGQLQHHQAHRAGAVDEVVVAQPAGQHVEAADRARQRLDQRRVRRRHALRQPEAVRHRRDRELGRAALDRLTPIAAQLLAEVAAPAPAVVALAAVQRRVDRHRLADPQLGDVGAEPRRPRRRTRGRARSAGSARTRRP